MMRTIPRRRWFLGIAGWLALLAAAPFAGREPAGRRLHTRLVRSEPARDTTVATAPREIRLWFSEAVTVPLTRVTLESGANVIPTGKAARAGGAEAPIVVAVDRTLAPGRYVVRWTTASADGHPVKGTYGFVIR